MFLVQQTPRSDEVFSPSRYTASYMFPRKNKYDFIQNHLVILEEEFNHHDTYSIIRNTDDITIIALALHDHKIMNIKDVYNKTLFKFEDFIVNLILNMQTEIYDSCSFISHYHYLFKSFLLSKIIGSEWKHSIKFTKSELVLMSNICPQFTIKKIAYELGICESTCRNHIQKIKYKMDVFSFDDFIKLSTSVIN